MKYSLIAFGFLFSIVSYSQSEISGKVKLEFVKKQELGYVLHVPKNTKEKKPLLIYLHGSKQKGENIEKVKVYGPFDFMKKHELDSYVLAPQCPENEYWDEEILYRLILKIQKENNIDSNRIYLTGINMGAWGAWNLVYAHPEMFAALVTVSGYVDRIPMVEGCKIKDVPTRIFHALLDDVVNVDYSIGIYQKLKTCSKDVQLTIFDDSGNERGILVYDDPKIYDWIFKQIKN